MLRNVTKCDTLNDRQLLALDLIVTGSTDTEVAAKMGVCRQTISRWRNSDADFIAELRRRRQIQFNRAADRLRALLDPAVDVIADQLNDRYEHTRFRAASTLLHLAKIGSVIAVKEEK